MESSTTVRLPFLDKKNSLPRLRDGDREKPGYRYSWRIFAQIADSMGVDVNQQDMKHWRTMFGITRAIDNMVDEEGCEDIEPALVLLLNGEPAGQVTKSEAVDFQASMAARSEAEQRRLISTIQDIATFAKVKAKATSSDDFLDLTRTEIEWYASLFKLQETGTKDSGSRRQFNEWLSSAMAAAYMFDSLLDMKEDYRNGNTLVEPTRDHKKALAAVAFREAARSLRKTPIRSLGGLAYVAYRNVHPPQTP